MQYFSSNKLLALIITLLIIPALVLTTELAKQKLDEPYRLFQYEEDENGDSKVTGWTENPDYIGGTPRTLLTFAYNTSPYAFQFIGSDNVTLKSEAEASGIVFLVSTALGIVSINKKEYS